EDLRDRRSEKCSPAGQKFVDDTPESPHIGSLITDLTANLFWTHVRRRPDNRATLGVERHRLEYWRCLTLNTARIEHHRGGQNRRLIVDGASRVGLRETKVEDFDATLRCHLDVSGLDIAVRDALRVRRLERLCDLTRNSEHLPCSHRSGSRQ